MTDDGATQQYLKLTYNYSTSAHVLSPEDDEFAAADAGFRGNIVSATAPGATQDDIMVYDRVVGRCHQRFFSAFRGGEIRLRHEVTCTCASTVAADGAQELAIVLPHDKTHGEAGAVFTSVRATSRVRPF